MTPTILSFSELTADNLFSAGGKGGSLARLYQAGFPVPDGFVILPRAFEGDDLEPDAWLKVMLYLERMRAVDPEVAFAVRSSALSEDSLGASFAGEFETVLNVHADEDIRAAIKRVYRSRLSERVQAYSRAKGIDHIHEVAVVVQKLVKAERSGVMFTANPVNGRRDQLMISAAWGLGEAIVGGLVTPDTIIVDKESGLLLNRETADKRVMTILKEQHTEEQPVPEVMRLAAVLSDREAAQLASIGARIEQLYGMPMDIEWTLDGGELSIVQARPITTLQSDGDLQELPDIPTDWRLPMGKYIAMRNNIVELMADPLTPLFRTLGLSAVNAAMGRTLSSFFGRSDVLPEDLIITVNQYAYYNGSFTAGQLGRILLSSVSIVKHMFTGAVERWTDIGRPRYGSAVARWQDKKWMEMPASEILNAARELSEAAIDGYMSLVSGVIPAAWISEALFTAVYKLLVKRRGDPDAPTFLLGYNSIPIKAEKSLYSLAEFAQAHPSLKSYLSEAPTARLAAQLEDDHVPDGVSDEEWMEWRKRFKAHLLAYGHTIYNLDFANPVPGDDPAPLLETCQMYIRSQLVDPYERQRDAAEQRERVTQIMMNRLKGLRLKLFRRFLASAQKYAPLREDGLADVGLSYPLLRQMLREMGRRLVQAGAIVDPDDIFWLEQDEVARAVDLLDDEEKLPVLSGLIPQRRAAWQAARQAAPPLMLPQLKIFGIDLAEIKSRRSKGKGEVIKGVAASPGRVTARARVLHSPRDFEAMEVGDVLVAAITTPAWTPLFARAAAIVTDVGGPLSHGSIVAREYGIPAVLGTGVATKRIRSGQIITVDGSSGSVALVGNGKDR